MLEKEEKNKWTAALRSGKYKQTKGTLKDHVGYCCIGVYAEANNIPISEDGDHMIVNYSKKMYDPLVDKIGDDNINKLWQMNDNRDNSFEEIADWIDQNL
jgi:hypothetical protein